MDKDLTCQLKEAINKLEVDVEKLFKRLEKLETITPGRCLKLIQIMDDITCLRLLIKSARGRDRKR